MKHHLLVLILSALLATGIVLTGGCAEKTNEPANQELPTQIIEDITAQEAFTLIQENLTNPGFVILDVRTPQEFTGGHLGDAVNIDLRAEDFREKVNELDKSKTYLVYCKSGARSRSASDIMEELGFEEGYNMLGGIIQWEAEELPIVK